MGPIYLDWRDYQNAVAAYFEAQGCVVRVEARVKGARATHAVDVCATFHQYGIECRWIIECKLWKRRVEKADILTFKGVVEDTGANCGIIFCENGFQSGARDAARHTNIKLITSLEDFKRTAFVGETQNRLVYNVSPQSDAQPIYEFPNGDQPQHLVTYDGRVFAANWEPGNIAIINPVTKSIESAIQLDKYETRPTGAGARKIAQYPPGDMACADGKLFVGQVFSDFVLVIDILTQAIIKRIAIPGGGEGAIAASSDGRWVYFASNRVNRVFVIDSATYQYEELDYPVGGRGCLCVLPHPSKPLLYVGIQRGGKLDRKSYPYGNCFLATYDLEVRQYVGNLYLAEIENGRSDDATPVALTYDTEQNCLFVGMFQSMRGICRVDEIGHKILANYRFKPNAYNKHFPWVDQLSQAVYRDKLVSVSRNNCELAILNRSTGHIEKTVFLGDAPNGPRAVVVVGDVAIVSYPARGGLIFYSLSSA